MLNMLTLALLLGQPSPSQAAEAGVEPLSVFAGDWKIVDPETGKVIQDCQKAQSFTVSADRKTVVLTEKWANNWTATYLVLHSEQDRVLMFIEGEKRRTELGDPILWWALFEGPDKFRWRQYDWAPDTRTNAQWQRCPTVAPQ